MKSRVLGRVPVGMALLSLLLICSCHKKLTNSTFLDRNNLEVREIAFDHFSTKTKINYTDGQHKINANANIRIRKDSLIWFSLTPALGIEAARGMIAKDSIVVLDRLNKQYFTYSYKELSEKYGFSISYHLIEAFVLGNPPFPIAGDDMAIREADYFLVEKKEGELTVRNFISANTSKLEKLHVVDPPSGNELNINYSRFQPLDELHIFPYQVLVSLNYHKPGQAGALVTQIEIEHHKVEVEDGKKLKFPFSIPQKYERK